MNRFLSDMGLTGYQIADSQLTELSEFDQIVNADEKSPSPTTFVFYAAPFYQGVSSNYTQQSFKAMKDTLVVQQDIPYANTRMQEVMEITVDEAGIAALI